MDVGYILTYVVCFSIIAYGINFRKSKRSISVMLLLKGFAYFYLAIAIFVNVLNGGTAERYVTGLTLGIAIIEGTTALKNGIEKIRENYEKNLKS